MFSGDWNAGPHGALILLPPHRCLDVLGISPSPSAVSVDPKVLFSSVHIGGDAEGLVQGLTLACAQGGTWLPEDSPVVTFEIALGIQDIRTGWKI